MPFRLPPLAVSRNMARQIALFVAVALILFAISPRPGLADDAQQAADIAVDAFAAGGAIVGVNLGPTEKALAKGVVACGVRGKPVVDCARDELVKTLPSEARPFARCVIQGTRVDDCAKRYVISKLPPEAQGLATCIAERSDFTRCGQQFALDERQRAAFNTLNALKADGRDDLGQPGTGTMRNILGLAQGIRDDNWGKVIQHGGPEIAKAAGKALLRVFLGPAAAPLDPAVDALIQSRVDLAVELFKAAKARDENRIARITIEAYVYLSLPIAQACALIPDGPVKEVTCGTIGKALSAFSSAGGDAVEWGVGTIKDVAGIFGIDTGEFVSACGRSNAYYAKKMAVCWPHLVQAKNLDKADYDKLEGDLNWHCRNHYHPCHDRLIGSTSSRLNEICNPLRSQLRKDVDKLNRAMKEAAKTYARAYPPMTFADTTPGEYCEARAGQQFIPDCINAMKKLFAVQGDGPRQACRPGGKDLGPASPLMEICAAAAYPEDKNGKLFLALRATCTPPCPEGMSGTYPNCTCSDGQVRKGDRCVTPTCERGKVGTPPNCQCPEGTRWNGRRCMPIPCPAGMVGKQPNCTCPANTTWNGQRCVRIACPAGMIGTQPNCRCPGNTYWDGQRCAPSACPRGMIGSQPNCRCPANTAWNGQRCAPLACPPTMVGTQPNCVCPRNTSWNGQRCAPIACPAGMIGTQPNCRCPGNTVWNGQRCAPRACPPTMVGTQPNCVCPRNTSWNGQRCAPLACPAGKVGTPPNCRCPQGTVARYGRCIPLRCPAGMVGTPPNCVRQAPRPPAACPMVRTCVRWGKGAPGTFAGPCLRYEMRRQCPPNLR